VIEQCHIESTLLTSSKVNQLHRTWLTIDCDDFRHVPANQGHPTRSKGNLSNAPNVLSEQFIAGMEGFEIWMNSHNHPVTLFIIADLFESSHFSDWVSSIINHYSNRLTIGCHGLSHRSWSAWPEDYDGFKQALAEATRIIKQRVGENWRPWFRAPGGYIAPWMARAISESGFTVDTSINPSWIVKKKAGKGNNWRKVRESISKNNLIEREWLNMWSLPVNGPALSLFPLSIISKMAWKKLPLILSINQALEAPSNPKFNLSTVYWHLLDHGRDNGNWAPPIPSRIFSLENNNENTESLKTAN